MNVVKARVTIIGNINGRITNIQDQLIIPNNLKATNIAPINKQTQFKYFIFNNLCMFHQ